MIFYFFTETPVRNVITNYPVTDKPQFHLSRPSIISSPVLLPFIPQIPPITNKTDPQKDNTTTRPHTVQGKQTALPDRPRAPVPFNPRTRDRLRLSADFASLELVFTAVTKMMTTRSNPLPPMNTVSFKRAQDLLQKALETDTNAGG